MLEEKIIEMHLQSVPYAKIATELHTGVHRISYTVKEYYKNQKTIPESKKRGAPSKVPEKVGKYIEMRTLQDGTLTNAQLGKEISKIFQLKVCENTIRAQRLFYGFAMERPHQRWTNDEDATLLENYNKYGPKWDLISSLMENRTPNQIKNRWYSHTKKCNIEKE